MHSHCDLLCQVKLTYRLSLILQRLELLKTCHRWTHTDLWSLHGGRSEILLVRVFRDVNTHSRSLGWTSWRLLEVVSSMHQSPKRFLFLKLSWHLSLGISGMLLVQRCVVGNPWRRTLLGPQSLYAESLCADSRGAKDATWEGATCCFLYRRRRRFPQQNPGAGLRCFKIRLHHVRSHLSVEHFRLRASQPRLNHIWTFIFKRHFLVALHLQQAEILGRWIFFKFRFILPRSTLRCIDTQSWAR